MTLDELELLTEALLNEVGFNLTTLRGVPAKLESLDDDEFALALRFVAGERATQPGRPVEGLLTRVEPAATPRRQRDVVEITEDEAARRLAALEELEEETPFPRGPVELGGQEFNGITLL